MPALEFECPRTRRLVSTGIEVDEASYKAISYSTTFIRCPHCPAPHRLSHLRSWLNGGNESTRSSKSSQNEGIGECDDHVNASRRHWGAR
jgi:hypothetical protein